MVKDTSCGRSFAVNETLYTVPWLPYGHERGRDDFDDVGKLYTVLAQELSRCGQFYSHDRGMWVCRECALKNGYIW